MTPAPDKQVAWTFEDLALFLGSILPALLISAAVLKAASVIAPNALATDAGRTLVFQGCIYLLLIGALYLLVTVRHGQPLWRSLGWIFPSRVWWVCVLASPLLALGLSYFGALLKAPMIPTPVERLVSGRISLAVVAIFATLVGPIFEELMFRGFLLPVIQRTLGAMPAIILSAAAFSLLHGAQYEWSWQHLTVIWVAGLVFGFVRYRSGSTIASALLHVGYNLSLLLGYLIERG